MVDFYPLTGPGILKFPEVTKFLYTQDQKSRELLASLMVMLLMVWV